MKKNELAMIELTEQQFEELEKADKKPLRVLNPRTNQVFVLLPIDEYERLSDYDDTPWTREELQALAWDASDRTEWDELDDFDHTGEKP